MNIHKLSTEKLDEEAARAFNHHILINKNRPTLLLFSGGSSFNLLPHIDTSLLNENHTLSVFDDRYTTDPSQNNFSILSSLPFFTEAVAKGAKSIDTKVAGDESLEEFGKRFETNLQKWREENPEGVVLATMGVGTDGHTGGMLPMPENPDLFETLFEDEAWAVGYDAGEAKAQFHKRATVTMTFIRNFVDYAAIYMVGESKRKSLEKILSENGTLAEAPCRIIREIKKTDLFTDIPTE